MGRYDSLSDATLSPTATAERVTAFLRAVYGWMAVGLGITAIVAAYIAGTNWAVMIMTNRWLLFALLIVQLGAVVTLSAGASRLAPGTASLIFVGYSALTAVTPSYTLLVYTGEPHAPPPVVQ